MKKSRAAARPKAAPEFVLCIRTCNADMTSHGGFRWPESGTVEAPDWNAEPVCGGGLHALANGVGDYGLLSSAHDAKWLVVKVAARDVVAIDKAKVKFPRGEVVYCGDMAGALTRISAAWVDLAKASAEGQHAAKDETHAAAQGDSGHAAAQGDYGAAFAGFHGRAKATAKGAFVIAWFDREAHRTRLVRGEPGVDGILPDTWYRVDDKGRLVVAS